MKPPSCDTKGIIFNVVYPANFPKLLQVRLLSEEGCRQLMRSHRLADLQQLWKLMFCCCQPSSWS